MIFTSVEFVIFFLILVLVRSCLTNFTLEKWFLLIASYVFYMSWSIPCGFLILFTSSLDYWVGLKLSQMERPAARKLLLVSSLFANLGILAYFKYTNFFLGTATSLLNFSGVPTSQVYYNIILPAGISFFTFQSMSYTIDVYRRQIPACRSMRDFLLFVSFFPQLIAGPIVRAVDFLPQLTRRIRPTLLDLEAGLSQFALGAVKKIVVSDQIAPHVDLIFANPAGYDAPTLLLGVFGYAIQIYCDFSGYSDMAIGSARMMGFHFMENFQMPYSSVTITEFWRRWHISLSTWLRDYLYIPLGGNRLGISRTYVNLFITMLLGGLWHGASWTFVVWGALHGVALAVHKAWITWDPLETALRSAVFRHAWILFSRCLTLATVLLGWIFFRAPSWSAAMDYLKGLFSWDSSATRFMSPYILAAVSGVALVHLFVPKDAQWAQGIPLRPLPVRVAAYTALLFLIVAFGATDSAAFIYFQF
ncbi:MAG TPA: MBOAT family protein [Verrucomicrobiae bacterium]|nr:MBOAT family protein [Verrucomicrobiae bacterium]